MIETDMLRPAVHVHQARWRRRNASTTHAAHMSSDSPVARRRVVVVDDHPHLRKRIAVLLAQTCDVVGTASDGPAALTAIGLLKPDVVVLDITLGEMSGLEVGRLVRQQAGRIRLVFYSAHDDEDVRRTVEALGRSALVLKGLVNELVAAVNG
jgi:DNA-binding NarL/FixJ family response regulator